MTTSSYLSNVVICFWIFSVSQAETTQADLRPEQQAKQQITVQPYVPFNRRHQNYLYISTRTNKVSVGDRLSMDLKIVTSEPAHRDLVKHITYLVRREHRVAISTQSQRKNKQMWGTDDEIFLRCWIKAKSFRLSVWTWPVSWSPTSDWRSPQRWCRRSVSWPSTIFTGVAGRRWFQTPSGWTWSIPALEGWDQLSLRLKVQL